MTARRLVAVGLVMWIATLAVLLQPRPGPAPRIVHSYRLDATPPVLPTFVSTVTRP